MGNIIGKATGETIAYTGWGFISGVFTIVKDSFKNKDYERRCYGKTRQKILGLIFFITWIIYGVAVALFWARISGNTERDNIFHYVGSIGAVASFLGWLVFLFDAAKFYVNGSSWPTINMTLMISFISISFVCSSILFYYATEPNEHSGTTETLIDALAYIVFGFSVLSFFSVLFIRFTVKMKDVYECVKEEENERRADGIADALDNSDRTLHANALHIENDANQNFDDIAAREFEHNRAINDQLKPLDDAIENGADDGELAFHAEQARRNLNGILDGPGYARLDDMIKNRLGPGFGAPSLRQDVSDAQDNLNSAMDALNSAKENVANGDGSLSDVEEAEVEVEAAAKKADDAYYDSLYDAGKSRDASISLGVEAEEARQKAEDAKTAVTVAVVGASETEDKTAAEMREEQLKIERLRREEEEARQKAEEARQKAEEARQKAEEEAALQRATVNYEGLTRAAGPPGTSSVSVDDLVAQLSDGLTESEKSKQLGVLANTSAQIGDTIHNIKHPKFWNSRKVGTAVANVANLVSPKRRNAIKNMKNEQNRLEGEAVKTIAEPTVSQNNDIHEKVAAGTGGTGETVSIYGSANELDAHAEATRAVKAQNIRNGADMIDTLSAMCKQITEDVENGGLDKMNTWDTARIIEILKDKHSVSIPEGTRQILIKSTEEIEKCAEEGKYKKKGLIHKGLGHFSKDRTGRTKECKKQIKIMERQMDSLKRIREKMETVVAKK